MTNAYTSAKSDWQDSGDDNRPTDSVSTSGKPGRKDGTRKVPSLDERRERDGLLEESVRRYKLTVHQVVELSTCWKHPFHDEGSVWRRINALGLRRFVKRVVRQTQHEKDVLDLLVKLWVDAVRNGYEVKEVVKEYHVTDGIRVDLRMELWKDGKYFRLYFIEGQRSAWAGWREKLRKFLGHRLRSKPFQVIICFKGAAELRKVYEESVGMMGAHEQEKGGGKPLELFLFGWIKDIISQQDSVSSPVWYTNLGRMVSLVKSESRG